MRIVSSRMPDKRIVSSQANKHTVQISEKHHSFLIVLGVNQGLNVEQTLEKLLDINMIARGQKPEKTNTGVNLTGEQQQAVDLALQGYSVQIDACAGSGKTTVLKRISNSMPEKKGLYLSFNRKNVDAAARSFPPNSVDCMTPHRLAYQAIGYNYRKRLNGGKLKGFDLAREIGIQTIGSFTRTILGEIVITVVNQFCYSADKKIHEKHIPKVYDPLFSDETEAIYVKQAIVFHAEQAWNLLCSDDCELPVDHDFYLKLWGLSQPKLEYQYIMFDEAQDANPTMLDIVMKQKVQVIMVGDLRQAIYAWRGAVNAMSAVKLDKRVSITQSFRYGQAIANIASRVVSKGLNIDYRILGAGQIQSEITNLDCKVILCRTNLKLIDIAMNLYQSRDNIKIHIVGNNGKNSELVNLLTGAADLKNNNRTLVPELMHFSSWNEVMVYSETEAGKNLAGLVRMANMYPIHHLTDTLIRISQNTEESADVILSTVHKAKGMEWDSVKLENDFPLPGSDRFTEEDVNLLYVAITRAKRALNIRDCHAVNLLM